MANNQLIVLNQNGQEKARFGEGTGLVQATQNPESQRYRCCGKYCLDDLRKQALKEFAAP
jgi:hypothetical protein